MAREKFAGFESSNSYVVDKDKALDTYIRYMLVRTQSMFTYDGLPDTIPAQALEKLLQTRGYCFITRVDGALYALYGGLGGEPDVYEEPTKITVANTALKLSREFDLEDDGVLMENDTMRIGILPILQKYGAMLVENTISMRTVDIILRMVCFVSAGDDKTQRGAEKFIQDIVNGKISAIAESSFFDGVRVQSVANSQNYLLQFIELEQYLKASCFNEIGLNANYNLKREYIGSGESSLNDDFLWPLVATMLNCRRKAIERINTMFGTSIKVDLAGPWRATSMENEKQVAIAESMIEGDTSGTETGQSDTEAGKPPENGDRGPQEQLETGDGENVSESGTDTDDTANEDTVPAETGTGQPPAEDTEAHSEPGIPDDEDEHDKG